jgi:hypothetical protein
MKVKVILNFSADGYFNKEEELDCLKQMLHDLDGPAVTISVEDMEIVEE